MHIATPLNGGHILAHQIGISVVFTHVRQSHIPIPVLGKDKQRTAACLPCADRTSIRDVIVMLK